mgnify:CR=1 FL=1
MKSVFVLIKWLQFILHGILLSFDYFILQIDAPEQKKHGIVSKYQIWEIRNGVPYTATELSTE